LSWHLEKQINIMQHCHEFSECRSAQYGMIRRFEVSNFEFNELGAVVLPRAEGDWKNHRAKWVRRIIWDNAVERRLARNQHVCEDSMSTLVSLTSATTGSRTRANLPGTEKLVHWSL
jgi:hypothetical protein